MKRYRIAEIICIVILLVFIGVLSADETASDKTVKEVAGAVISDVSIKGLTKQSEMQIKKELSLTAKEYDGIYFAKSDDVMDVREILIIKLKENQSAEDAIKKIDGVNDATVSFLAQKMTIDVVDEKFDDIMKEVVAVCAKVEPDCKILM